MKWNDWNLIAFGFAMGVVPTGTLCAVVGLPNELFIGKDGRIQWETLLTGFAAVLMAALTIHRLKEQIRLTSALADDQRRRRGNAARAVLPLALSELAEYAIICVRQLYSLQSYFCADGSLDKEQGEKAISTWTSPHLSDNVLAVLKECIEFVDDTPAAAVIKLIQHLQVQQARLREYVSRLQLNDGVHLVVRANIDQAMFDSTEIYARSMPLFVFARGRSVGNFEVTRGMIYGTLSLAGCFRDYDEIDALAGKWQREFSAREAVEEAAKRGE